jgi:adenylyltransferase/sulfurtransferase
VIGVVPGIIGCIQAAEVIRTAMGYSSSLIGRLLTVDVAAMSVKRYRFWRNPSCELCGRSDSLSDADDQ